MPPVSAEWKPAENPEIARYDRGVSSDPLKEHREEKNAAPQLNGHTHAVWAVITTNPKASDRELVNLIAAPEPLGAGVTLSRQQVAALREQGPPDDYYPF